MKKRLIIVANRLPINVKKTKGDFLFSQSAGGLATGLNSLKVDYEKHWIGWPGLTTNDEKLKTKVRKELEKEKIHPVFLTKKELHHFYEGFSNKTIWPLFHYFSEYTEYNQYNYEIYERVNRLFCEKVVKTARKDDIIWVQDYQLMLLPGMLKERLPETEIGFFLHIPFPSYELFRTLPFRKELLKGVLGADLIGFHTYEYMRHFMSAIYRILGLEPHLGIVNYKNRSVQVDTYPMGIDFEKYFNASKEKTVEDQIRIFKNRFKDTKIILSVDRLDYSKGIINRLKAFDRFLQKYPKYKNKISLLMVTVPSRDTVDQYQTLKEEIDELVGKINGKYSSLKWTPIHYFYRAIPFEQLSALYNIADVGLVTPLRDGMNLVAKEFIASKTGETGTLILSEMAGAAIELVGAHIINPNDIEDIADSINSVLQMPKNEQAHRIRNMQSQIRKQTVGKWANDFIRDLDKISLKQKKLEEKAISADGLNEIISQFRSADKKLILLDYDGTLVNFAGDPGQVAPDQELKSLISEISEDPDNKVIIMSGRDHNTLEEWFGNFAVDMIAEHGSWNKENNIWKQYKVFSDKWKDDIREILQEFVNKTPGSFLEEKPYSMVWHYRKTDVWLSDIRAQELINSLIYPCSRYNLEILDNNKAIEVKIGGVNKGKAIQKWLAEDYDFILAAGDDRTDEEIFKNLPDHSISIKIGFQVTDAKFTVKNWQAIRKLLRALISNKKEKVLSK